MQSAEDLKKDRVIIENYNENWPKLAKKEITTIKNSIQDENFIDIQHIGSTSIPNAMAKPIIDIYLGVASIEEAKLNYVEPVVALGYVYWAENPNPNKLFFVKGMPPFGERRTHHVHIVKMDSLYWRDRIIFRDYLRKNPQVVNSYNELKL